MEDYKDILNFKQRKTFSEELLTIRPGMCVKIVNRLNVVFMLTLNHIKKEFLFAVGHHSKAFMPPLSTNKLPISSDSTSNTPNGLCG